MRRPLSAALLALVVAGCGSTIQPGADSGAGGQTLVGQGAPTTGDGLSVPTVAPRPATGDGTTPPIDLGGAPTATGPAVVVGGKGAKHGTGSARPTSAATRSGSARPVDHSPIRIGLLYGKDVGAAAALVGITGLSTGDTLAESQAVVHWVNAHGGVGGHPITLLSYAIDATSSASDTNEAYEAGCTALTQDDHVRYVVTILSLPPGALPCFAKAGVGVLDDESGVGDAQAARYSGYLAGPGDISLGRAATNLVDDLWRRGWLNSKSKVGTLTYDEPQMKAAVTGPLTRALAAHGLRPAAEAAIPDSTAYFTQTGGVVLRFRAAGVDRVLALGTSPLSLMLSASTQGYHPEFEIDSSDGPGALLEGTAPKNELVNSAGIGWQPFLDIGRGKHPGPVSASQTLCFKLMAAAGQASSSATTRGFEAQVCDLLFYLKAMGDALPALPSNLLTAARSVIGDSFRPADTFRSDMRQHPDGVAAYRDLAYETGCSCYQYVSGLRRAQL